MMASTLALRLMSDIYFCRPSGTQSRIHSTQGLRPGLTYSGPLGLRMEQRLRSQRLISLRLMSLCLMSVRSHVTASLADTNAYMLTTAATSEYLAQGPEGRYTLAQ